MLATTKNSEILFPAQQQISCVTTVKLINLCAKWGQWTAFTSHR